jgi:hypothetical protein
MLLVWYTKGDNTIMPVETIEAAKELVEKWVSDRGYPISAIPASDDYSFQFGRISNLGIGFAVVQPKSIKRAVVVATRVALDPFHIKALESADDREDFLWSLKERLVFVLPAFSFDNPNVPTSIEFSKEISFDELTEGRLQDVVDQTIRCVLWVSWVFVRKFGRSEESKK